MPVTKEKRKVEKTEEFVTAISCDRCLKEIRIEEHEFATKEGYGYFCPVFPYPSKLDSSPYEEEQIYLCDTCWDAFYNFFIANPIKNRSDNEG